MLLILFWEVQYRFSLHQDIDYLKERVGWLGFIKWKFIKIFCNHWQNIPIFTYNHVEFEEGCEHNNTRLFIRKQSEFDSYKNLFKTYGDLKRYVEDRNYTEWGI